MKCYKCGGEYKEIRDERFRVDDKLIGTFYVDNVFFMECEGCADRLFAAEDAKKLEVARQKTQDEILKCTAIGEYLSAAETATLLGISRQALNKHRRITRGFIYQTNFGGKKVYLKKSVNQFIAKGDGRFMLRESKSKPSTFEKKNNETGRRAGVPSTMGTYR